MEKKVVFASKQDRYGYLYNLSAEVREPVLGVVEERLTGDGLSGTDLANGIENALHSKLCDVEEIVPLEYLETDPLRFYVVNNLRSQQDKTSFDVYRYHSLDEAYEQYAKFAEHYTAALGIIIAPGREIDLVHSRGGEPILVTDYRRIDGFRDNSLVLQAVDHVVGKLGIQREGNYELFNQWIEIPLDRGEGANSYLDYKRLLPENPKYPISAINEAFCDGRGWVKAEDLFQELSDYDPYINPVHLKISCVNVNYIRTDTKEVGQMDLIPSQLGIMLERFKEMDRKVPLCSTIEQANKKRDAQAGGHENEKNGTERGER